MNIKDENSTKTFSQQVDLINNRYMILQEIYQNQKNSVLLVTDLYIEKDIALKISLSSIGNSEIRDEFKKIINFFHPNIIRVFDIHTLLNSKIDKNSPLYDRFNSKLIFFYTMEYIKPQFDENMIQMYIKQIFEIFYTIHNKNMIHNDIKLNNFIFSKNRVVLIDFSSSQIAKEDDILIENNKLSKFIIQWINHLFNVNILDEPKIGKKILSDFYYKQIINFFYYKQDRIFLE